MLDLVYGEQLMQRKSSRVVLGAVLTGIVGMVLITMGPDLAPFGWLALAVSGLMIQALVVGVGVLWALEAFYGRPRAETEASSSEEPDWVQQRRAEKEGRAEKGK